LKQGRKIERNKHNLDDDINFLHLSKETATAAASSDYDYENNKLPVETIKME